MFGHINHNLGRTRQFIPMLTDYEHFLNRAQRLEESRFWSWLTTRRGEPDWNRIKAGDWLAHDGLNIDELEAFCLNLRLLIQDRDGISIRAMRHLSNAWPSQYSTEAAAIDKASEELRQCLAERSLVELWSYKKTTNHELFDVVFYGGIAHSDRQKREEFENIVKSGLFSVFAFQAFSSVLFHYRNCIIQVAKSVATYVAAQERHSVA